MIKNNIIKSIIYVSIIIMVFFIGFICGGYYSHDQWISAKKIEREMFSKFYYEIGEHIGYISQYDDYEYVNAINSKDGNSIYLIIENGVKTIKS